MKYNEIIKHNRINIGSTSVCYLLEDGRVFKEFVPALNKSNIEKYRKLLNIQNRSFKFPIDLVYDNDYLYGYVMGYANGIELLTAFNNVDLEKLSIHTIPFENDIKKLSNEGIKLVDLHSSNILYDRDKLTAVDTDDYSIDKLADNLLEYNVTYYKRLLSNLFEMNLNKLENIDFILNKTNDYVAIKSVTSSEMIYQVLELLRKKYGSDIKSINDIKVGVHNVR